MPKSSIHQSRPSGGLSPPGPQSLGYHGCSDELPYSQPIGNGSSQNFLGVMTKVQVLLISEKEKVMSWQSDSSISLDRGYPVPRSLLHLGPLVKKVAFTSGCSAWPALSTLASNVRTFASFDEISRTVEPFSALTRFSDSPRLPLSDDTRVCGFSFSGSRSGPRFLVLASLDDISQTAAPFLSTQAFLDSHRRQLPVDTKVYGFLINGSRSGPRSVVLTPPTTATTGSSHGTRPSSGLPTDRKSCQMTEAPFQPHEDPCRNNLLDKTAMQPTSTSFRGPYSSSSLELDRKPLEDAKTSTVPSSMIPWPLQHREKPRHNDVCVSIATGHIIMMTTSGQAYDESSSLKLDGNSFTNSKANPGTNLQASGPRRQPEISQPTKLVDDIVT